MRTVLVTTACLASLATLCGVAAHAHQTGPAPATNRPVNACPCPRPGPTPAAHAAGPHCVQHHAAMRQRRGPSRAYAGSQRLGPDDVGVAPSQALAYQRELARDRRDLGQHSYAQRGPAPGPSVRSYSYQHQESHGYVERDGQRYAWSSGSGGPPPPPGAGPWRPDQGSGYEVYRYTGRDQNGFLVWPGKPRAPN